jgi:acyl-[acyl-carrier-protein]-phospholipid O-acyltransferase/long-chain-fatty-acid--[acyl-carrier-protein] ligase
MKNNLKTSSKANTTGTFARFIIKCFIALFYRIKTNGIENIPPSAPALLVSNHVTTIDAMLIAIACKRRICLVIDRDLMTNSRLKPLFNLMNTIQVSANDTKREIVNSLKQAKYALAAGHLVCVFPEEKITSNGNMRHFKQYLLHIVKNNTIPIIPVYIGGVWGSTFSNFHEKMISSRSTRMPYHAMLTFGCKRDSDTSMEQIREVIQKLSVTYFNSLKSPTRNLRYYFIKSAKANWSREALGDTTGKRLSFGKTLIASITLSRKLSSIMVTEEKIGIMLPSSVGGALANIAITLAGKIPVNINFSTSSDAVNSAINQCNIQTVITSRSFIKHLPHIKINAGVIYIEEIIKTITPANKLKATINAIFLSAEKLAGKKHPATDDLATIIFSSGSTGEQKGIMLSHHNIISNIESFLMIYHFKYSDKMCAILPFFHSFGFTTTLWCPLLQGFTAFYHPNPLEGETIAKIVEEEHLTIMLSTPTFLTTYLRKATRKNFSSLRLIITGAEKLRKNTADRFETKFNIRPIEGYGTTELSPVAAANVPDIEFNKSSQTGTKEGSIGHPIPGVAMRITDIDTGDPLPTNEEGMLETKGPNVMLGYLNNPELTNSVMHDGWYVTGDIARIDEDGFIFIHDRLSRFSKIGGEMVPHMMIEDEIITKLKLPARSIFIASAPDHKRGEQLIVIYTPEAGCQDDIKNVINDSKLPNLWKPRRHNYLEIKEMPIAGSGKLNMRRLTEIAHEFIENKPSIVTKTITKIRESL